VSLLLLQRGVWLGVVRQRGGRLIADGVAGGDVGGYLQLAFALGGENAERAGHCEALG
jgi:hypothetical protein